MPISRFAWAEAFGKSRAYEAYRFLYQDLVSSEFCVMLGVTLMGPWRAREAATGIARQRPIHTDFG